MCFNSHDLKLGTENTAKKLLLFYGTYAVGFVNIFLNTDFTTKTFCLFKSQNYQKLLYITCTIT